jgi:hypothetical protein
MCYWNLTGYYERDGRIRFSGPCVVTGKLFSVVVSQQGAHNYFEENALAQDAFPELSHEEREFLISGVSPEGWRQLFNGESRSDDSIPASPVGLWWTQGAF